MSNESYLLLITYYFARGRVQSAFFSCVRNVGYGTPPLRLSLQGTRHHLNNFIPELLACSFNKTSSNLLYFT
jgi:hypothetical protein